MESTDQTWEDKRPKKKTVKPLTVSKSRQIVYPRKIPSTSKTSHHPKKLPSINKQKLTTNISTFTPTALPKIIKGKTTRLKSAKIGINAKQPKDITPEICNLFYFTQSKHTFLYIPNSFHQEKVEMYKSFQIKYTVLVPYSYKMRIFQFGNMPKCITDSCEKADMKYKKKIENSNIIWRLLHPDKMRELIRAIIHKNQKFNHFPTTYQLGRKDNMYRHYKHFKSMFPNDYNYVPMTFILPFDSDKFELEYQNSKKQIWIVKPVNLSRGRGIHLLKSFEEYKKLLSYSCKDNYIHYLLSKYISNPHLIGNKKYDLRIYVLVTSFQPLKIFLYDNGLVRFATEDYKKGNYDNIYVHLTNYSINKNNINYKSNLGDDDNEDEEEDDNSSKWSLFEYKNYFIKNKKMKEYENLKERMKDIIIKTIITIANDTSREIPYNKTNSVFELFGFDIMVDSNFNPWLIEVNCNPSLHCTSPLDLNIKTNLISDIFNVVGIIPYHHKIPNKIFNFELEEQDEKFEFPEENNKSHMAVKSKIIKGFNPGNLKNKGEDYSYYYYQKMIQNAFEEKERSSITGFERIFPTKNNIEKYAKFLIKEGVNDCDIVFWQHLLTKKES